jgi:hypothetical protein
MPTGSRTPLIGRTSQFYPAARLVEKPLLPLQADGRQAWPETGRLGASPGGRPDEGRQHRPQQVTGVRSLLSRSDCRSDSGWSIEFIGISWKGDGRGILLDAENTNKTNHMSPVDSRAFSLPSENSGPLHHRSMHSPEPNA